MHVPALRPGRIFTESPMTVSHTWIEALAAAAVAGATAMGGVAYHHGSAPMIPSPETVIIRPGSLEFEPVGEYLRAGVEFDPEDRAVTFEKPLEMTKFQVSYGDYMRCVETGECERPETRQTSPDAPVTGVSFYDATAYAEWLSSNTDGRWRLPSAEEWAYAAAERFAGEVFSRVDDPSNPAVAWIRRYEEQVRLDRKPDPVAHRQGHFGPNSNGIYDFGGNVWEWTTACYTRTDSGSAGGPAASEYENCGIRVAEGVHRAYMTDFLRDGKSGGCAVGTPPDHLGIRLVRDRERFPLLSSLLRTALRM